MAPNKNFNKWGQNLFIIYMWHDPQIVILVFLILSQIRFITTITIRHWKMLVHRYVNKTKFPIKIHAHEDIYWPYDNYYVKNEVLYDERQLILRLMKSIK